jgi:hypothetical protein
LNLAGFDPVVSEFRSGRPRRRRRGAWQADTGRNNSENKAQQPFRQVERLRRHCGDPNDAVRHDLQPHPLGRSPARLNDYAIRSPLVALIGASTGEGQETKGAERQ